MIARLTGKIIDMRFTECVVDVNGVGYQVFIPMSTYDKLPREGETASLFICTQVREDAISLYGFAGAAEKELFEILIGTTGVGPKLALSILSSMPVERFTAAIVNGDLNVIKRISGIGKKTAERLIVELKDKFSKLVHGSASASGAIGATGEAVPDEKALAMDDAAAALEQLGFKSESIRKVLNKISSTIPLEEASSENFIRKALQALNG